MCEWVFISGEINTRVENMDTVQARLTELEATFSGGHSYTIDGFSAEFDDWHFNVRASNTEPLLRLNLEAVTADRIAADSGRPQPYGSLTAHQDGRVCLYRVDPEVSDADRRKLDIRTLESTYTRLLKKNGPSESSSVTRIKFFRTPSRNAKRPSPPTLLCASTSTDSPNTMRIASSPASGLTL